MAMTTGPDYRFDAFRLVPAQRTLWRDGRVEKVGARAFDLLHTLVERHGQVVSKDELLDRVWPEQDVGEANLAVQVMALRRLLGQTAITTVPGRGYCFTRPLHVGGVAVAGSPSTAAPSVLQSNLAAWQDELLGRVKQ
jgi:DNA-binding winged helix-turn-helix (wHTH) protein